MLLPQERQQAIDLLTNNAYNGNLDGTNYAYGGSSDSVKNLLKFGFRGFAQFTDPELLRALQTLAKKSNAYDIKNFISTIAADKFMLE